MENIRGQLLEHIDEEFAAFQRRLIPNIPPESILGVRSPILRKMAAQISKEAFCRDFLRETHVYFEECLLHGYILSLLEDFECCVKELEAFFPQMNNWAVCDYTSPGIFRKNKEALLLYLEKWLASGQTYTVRFAIVMFMQHFLEEDFKEEQLFLVTKAYCEEYYVNMAIAWYMATALAFQWEAAISYVEDGRMPLWLHNRTIQKAVESRRITKEQKAYLRSLRRK